MNSPTKSQSQGPKEKRLAGLRRFLKDFMFGMTSYELVQEVLEMRTTTETLFIAVTLGDMIGLPIIPPYYTLRLLPHMVPNISTWKRRVLREREFTDEHVFHLHGL